MLHIGITIQYIQSKINGRTFSDTHGLLIGGYIVKVVRQTDITIQAMNCGICWVD